MTDDDPVTLATVAVIGSTAMSATSAVAGGLQAKAAAGIQAQQMQRQAQLENQAAGAKISEEDVAAGRTIASDVAATGAAGVTEASATPIITENATEQKIKDMYTRYGGKLAASSDLYAAQYAKYQGTQAMWAGFFGGAQSVLGGVGKLAQLKMASSGANIGVGSGSGTI